ncbi:MAG: squalene synthase HpnC [Melioribacteraceae bacterium]|nr:squalene synthase HpnC [Melioribacteraceae bacterium]MCF8265715.1 squalene synthase HpnC [Melioribacteraceae bacterium]
MNDKEQAYRQATKIAKSHYENFPVVSIFVPKELRKHVAVIYMFAREADDLADEGNESAEIKLKKLDLYASKLSESLKGDAVNPFWKALNFTVIDKKLSPQYLFDLLDAFKQDLVKTRYTDSEELYDYCKRSANPVGRLILELYNIRDENLNRLSDKICTALQITNFIQDVSIDLAKGRIYIPNENQTKFGVSEADFQLKKSGENFKMLIQSETESLLMLYDEGKELIDYLPIPLNKQIKWTINGGEKILKKIREIDYDVLNYRPKLTKWEYFTIGLKALF